MSTAVSTDRLKTLLTTDGVKSRFVEMLGQQKAAGFMSSIISAVNANDKLKECEPMSVIAAASVAAAMDLPINQSLGMAHIVPYSGKAQFQIGWKGFMQLALRTGQYKTINPCVVYEGQLVKANSFTGEMEFKEERTSDKVAGYLLYFKLLNGYDHYFYMTKDAMEAHAQRYSIAYKKGWATPWKEDFDAMGLKTVIKLGLGKFGVLSIEMQKAMEVDQAVVNDKGEAADFPDADKPEATVEEPGPKAPAAAEAAVAGAAKPAEVVAPGAGAGAKPIPL